MKQTPRRVVWRFPGPLAALVVLGLLLGVGPSCSGGGKDAPTAPTTPTTPVTATQLQLTTSAAGAAIGAAFTTQPVVAIRDAAGNTVTSGASVVTMTVSAGGTVVGTATRTAVSGVATFSGVGLSGTAATYTLTFAASGLTSATQSVALLRVYTNYLQPSYVTHNMGRWLSGDDLLTNGLQDKSQDPLGVVQTAQLDIDGDGLDDVLTFDSYPMGTGAAIPLPVPPRQFIARGDKLHYVVWQGPTLRQPHGVKLLVGDFNGDSLPDVFSLVGFDPPNGTFPVLRDFNHVLFNSKSGFKDVWEFDDQLGFWITGASGDIDGDGDLDVVAFNFHVQGNGVPSRILWNDGKGHFTSDPSGIGFIPTVDASELVDVNGDGVLDLVISNVIADPVSRVPSLTIMWGNRGGFSLSRSVSVTYGSKTHATDLSFFDVNKDGIQDILLTYSDESGNYGVQVFLVLDAGTRLSDATSSYVDTAVGTRRFDRARLQDVDGNGLIDLIGVDRRSGVRWEWNGSRFIKRF